MSDRMQFVEERCKQLEAVVDNLERTIVQTMSAFGEKKLKQLEMRLDKIEGKDEFSLLKAEVASLKTELRSEKIGHTKTMNVLHSLQAQLTTRKRHCLEAHQCCYEPPVEKL